MKLQPLAIWGAKEDGYGFKRWGINDKSYGESAGWVNISGAGFYSRKEAEAEFSLIRKREREFLELKKAMGE